MPKSSTVMDLNCPKSALTAQGARMVNWSDIQNLHVITKMESILSNWFGTELFWTDVHGKIHSGHLDKDYSFKSHFMKVQLRDMKYGYEYLTQDIERATEE